MKILLQQLISVLQKEIELHNQLLKLAQEKEMAIINNQISLLQEVTKKEAQVIEGIKEQEQARIEVINQLARYFEISTKDLTMSKLVALIDAEMSGEFKKLHKEIVSLIDKLRRVNERNNSLIKTSLELISYSMNLFINLSAGEAVYNPKGKLAKKFHSHLIFDKTI